MPDFVGGIPLGPPDYVDFIPEGENVTQSQGPFDPYLPPPPINGFAFPPQPQGTALVACGMSVVYSRDWGIRGAPLAGPFPQQAAIWRVHGGLVYKTVTGVFQSIGGPPTLPQPVINNNEILLMDAPGIPSNQVMGDGTPVYVRTVQYVFLLQQPPDMNDPLYGCVIQLDTSGISANAIDPRDYVANLLGPIPPPAGYSGRIINF